ncbi:MAG TPA: hypothetical protein VHH11_14765 [Gammaproteobacteria bacterium]|nr:hypothetical protein [Gammaproteobacteria bacterium]
MYKSAFAAAALTWLVVHAPGAHAAEACDRDCLIGIADAYLAAIAAHAPDRAPLAANVRFVENTQRLKPGEGIWAAAAGKATAFRINVPDPVQGSIGVMTLLDRRGPTGIVKAQIAVRLKIEGGRITEAEHIVADVPAAADPKRLEAPRPHLVAVVPERERMPRAELARIAGSYYDALDDSDGKLAPFAADCEREENMLITAGPGLPPAPFDSVDLQGRSPPPVARDCIGQMSSRRFAYIDTIEHRRIVAVDPVQGLAMGLSHFRQSMNKGPLPMITADGRQVLWAEKKDPYDLPAAHIFKITGGQIHEVEAIGIFIPYNSPTGWE